MANQPPVGYRFKPYDEELIVDYLMRKINNQKLPCNMVQDVNVYEHNPEELHDMYYRANGEDVCYFFTQREKKNKRDKRPSRAAKDGFWKASTGEQEIFHGQVHVGFQRTLVYWRGKPGPNNAEKTSWIMHEYYMAMERHPPSQAAENDNKFHDLVICKIYTATKGSKKKKETRHHPYARSQTVSEEGSQLHSNESESSTNVAPQFENVHDSFSMDSIPSTTDDRPLSIEDYGYNNQNEEMAYSSDQVPTPIAIPAEQEDIAAAQLISRLNPRQIEFLKNLDLSDFSADVSQFIDWSN